MICKFDNNLVTNTIFDHLRREKKLKCVGFTQMMHLFAILLHSVHQKSVEYRGIHSQSKESVSMFY